MAGAAAGRVTNHCGEAITVRKVLGKDKSKLLFHRATAITLAYLSSKRHCRIRGADPSLP